MSEPLARPERAGGGTGDLRGPRIGLIVNPIAGIGGAVGLKGSDGPETLARARALGAVPHAVDRAAVALERLVEAWPAGLPPPELLAAPGPMGADVASRARIACRVVGILAEPSVTTAADTCRIAAELLGSDVDLLLIAGGDGTARDVCAAVGVRLPVLGIPAGVKIHSAVYATSPRAAGAAAAVFLASGPSRRRTALAEVLDLDEDAYRAGSIAARLFGELRVPGGDRRLQARKEPSPASDAVAAAAVAEGVVRLLPAGPCILGPGSTVRAVAARLGVAKTLVGADVVDVERAPARPGSAPPRGPATPRGRVIALDVGAAELERLVTAAGPVTLVVTPIGGQGFVLGRGDQQLSPAVVRAVLAGGPGRLVVAATPAKLASLHGRPMLVDTGDRELDAALAGHVSIVTGPGERTIHRLEPG